MRFALALACAGCNHPAVPERHEAKPVVPVVVAWHTEAIRPLQLVVDAFDAAPFEYTAWDRGGGAVGQTISRNDESARWLVRAARDERLANWLADHQDWRVASIRLEVCGDRVPGWTADHDAQDITCVMTATGNHPAHIPPRHAVAVEFEHAGNHVVASAEIESADVPAWQPVIDHFLRSIRCPRD
jgi:hypothetical protein